jgi:hypothetical protein
MIIFSRFEPRNGTASAEPQFDQAALLLSENRSQFDKNVR